MYALQYENKFIDLFSYKTIVCQMVLLSKEEIMKNYELNNSQIERNESSESIS
jgi:hypothetical protein